MKLKHSELYYICSGAVLIGAFDIPIITSLAACILWSLAILAIFESKSAYQKDELCAYLDALDITSENIGDLRRSLFLPWDSSWNSLVRDETARREGKLHEPR